MGWVRDRADCTLAVAFETIKDFVEQDMEEANNMSRERGLGNLFSIEKGPDGPERRFVVSGYTIDGPKGGEKRRIAFILGEDRILVNRTGPETLPAFSDLLIKQRWDFPSATCSLCVDGKPRSAHEISQLALEPLFFLSSDG